VQSLPIFTRVGTYVQRGSKFCFVVLLGADTLLKFLHYCPISPCIQQPCPAALPQPRPGSLAPQPCSAVRPISTGFDALAPQSPHCTTLQWQVTKLHARAAAVLTGLNLFLVQFHHAFIICMCCARCCPPISQFIASFLRKRG
jgi:hypothetical protein